MKFDYESVNEYCKKLEVALKEIRKKYDDCETQINHIKSSNVWVGPAANNFIAQGKATLNVCRKTEESLIAVIDNIRNCYKNYESTENDIIKVISTSLK